MNINTLKELISIAGSLDGGQKSVSGDMRPVIVRSRDAGVLFGNLAATEGNTIHLENAVQMWRWKAAKGGTLLDCAQYGVDASGCKFSEAKGRITIFNACALIDCTIAAAKSIDAVKGGEWS
jgi:hypothetical protein